ncbi:MAG: hypothetical protein M1828_005747 [Chrysothrix sp. TS-e1954]|nr:MAG: hypothetical protein M1828_005747 [Chrysothrix sp. TS-e1954]
MEQLKKEHDRLEERANLSRSIGGVQSVIDQLISAKEAVRADPSTTRQTLEQLESTVRTSYDKINDDLKDIYNGLNKFSRAVEKKFKDNKPMTFTESEALSTQPHLVNRAIAMHLLREGHFNVASSFITETNAKPPSTVTIETTANLHTADYPLTVRKEPSRQQSMDMQKNWHVEFVPSAYNSTALQQQFEQMYTILQELKQNRNLDPAIEWARSNRAVLDKRGSNLEFDLCRLRYVSLFISNAPGEGPLAAVQYAQITFPRFPSQYSEQIRQLLGALAFVKNITRSPYASLFSASSSEAISSTAATAFTSEFCALLSLSSASPLLTAVTAGCIALPTLLKFSQIQTTKRTTWTTPTELPVEIALPPSFRFHSIFVCPVSKEQGTDSNPPMMMPCAHVVAKESLEKLSKNGRFKCPYCPNESHPKDAREVVL